MGVLGRQGHRAAQHFSGQARAGLFLLCDVLQQLTTSALPSLPWALFSELTTLTGLALGFASLLLCTCVCARGMGPRVCVCVCVCVCMGVCARGGRGVHVYVYGMCLQDSVCATYMR